jgi:non-ribosomal peptide synthetase component E (peptide arylation enzyme)
MRLIDYFDRGAGRYPERACLVDGNLSWSYREIQTLSHRVAGGLLAAGLRDESRVAIARKTRSSLVASTSTRLRLSK